MVCKESRILKIKQKQHFTIYDLLGQKMMDGNITNNEQIEISHLKNAMYFIQLRNGVSFKFLKE